MTMKNGKMLFDDELKIVETAELIWYQEWVRQGRRDEGTCCLGKGIHILSPFKAFINAQAGQGNVTAWQSAEPVKEYLTLAGVTWRYDDGRMD
tara:strand:+ start:636 stop:914 length:279 start_codon:yes stop_codon:yes gene_type:complete